MSTSLSRHFSVLVLFATIAFVNGCALTNPYIDFEKYKRTALSAEAAVQINDGVNYARETKDAYRKALGDRAEFRNWTGIGLIPLMAAALALGIDGGHSTTILGLGMSGAAVYGIATWLDSNPTERAYIAGYNAINCAMDAVEPFRIAKTDPDYNSFEASLKQIDTNIAEVQKQIGLVRSIVGSNREVLGVEAISQANADVQAATTVVDNAVTVRRNGVSLRREINLTGTRLVATVDRIVGEVDMAVLRSQPDLQTLAGIIGGLGQAYGQFTAVPESVKSAKDIGPDAKPGIEQTDTPQEQLRRETTELQKRVAELSTTTRKVGDFVNAVVAAKPVESLKRCGVAAEQIAGDIAVEPDGPIEFSTGAQSEAGRVIVGGRAPYRASLVGTAPGITVIQPELFGPAFVVQARVGTTKGEYSVLVADGAGHRQIIPVIVQDGKPDIKGKNGDSKPDDSLIKDLTKEQISALQRAVCTPENEVDGVWGKNTRKRFNDIKRSFGAGKSDEVLRDELVKMTEADVESRCKKNPTQKEIEDFSEALTGTAFMVGPNDEVSFIVKSTAVSADKKSAVVELQHVPGDPPEQPITIDQVKDALISTAGTAGTPVSKEHVTIKNPENVEMHLKKP